MKASKLRAVQPEMAEPSKPKILIYGRPGVGKTWVSMDFPSVYYIDTEGGANLPHYVAKLKKSGGVYLGPEQDSTDFRKVIEEIKALATVEHPYRTLVIDSISKLFINEITTEAERLGDKNAFGADKKPAVALMRQLIQWIQRLDMNVILIAHEKPLWGMVNGQRAEIGTTFDAWDKLEYELHLALNIVNMAGQRKAMVRKSRLESFADGSAFSWSYDNFAELYGKSVIEKESKQLILATPAQVEEIKRLIETLKLPEGTQEKWLSTAGVADFAEMDEAKLKSLIAYVRDKFLPKPTE